MFRSSPRSSRRMRGDILFGPLFFIGIIAAIAVPAYQDYTVRSQVLEGLNLASGVKASIAESFAATGTWPANLKQLGYTRTPRSHYVTSVTVRNSVIVIRYGDRASQQIAGRQLTLRPTLSPQQDIIWLCGYVEGPGLNAEAMTNVLPKHLPSSCR